jgi:NAD(P)H-nitrite reductase large subunit
VLAREVPATEDIIVIGGGLIGLQAAEALSKVGVNVTVIEMLDRVLALAVDEYASSLIRSEFERHGVKIVTSTRVAEIGRNESSGVASVVLGDGREIPCQSVILAAGVTPRTELAALAGIKVNRGISVDDYMRTSAENVYAAGDVAETRELLSGEHRLIPIWPNAYMEGRIAGLSMAGRSVPYQGGLTMNAAHFFDFPVISSGVSQAGEGYDNSIQVNEHTGYYRRIILKKNVPVGMVMAGDAVDRSGLILSLIRNQTDCTSFLPELADTGFNTAHLPQDLRRIKQLGKERI